MIDLQTERQRKAFARVRDSIIATQHAIIAGLDQVLESLEDIATVVAIPAKAESTPQLVDVERAAEILSINKATLWNLVSAGKIEFIELPSGRGDRPMKRFSVADLQRFLDAHSKVAS